jgi:tRNA threonylcarbamoyladenosine biosynthesis protein TsaB
MMPNQGTDFGGMKILAVDTSTSSGSVALLDGPQVLCEWTRLSALTHNRRLLATIDSMLREVDWEMDRLDGLAVTAGPGSFTGLRIGLTTVKTLAWAGQKLFVTISSLDALAAPFSFASLPVCTLIDARKKEVYCALYRPDGKGRLQKKTPYQVLPPHRVIEQIKEPTLFCGDGWLLYRDMIERELGDFVIAAPAPYHMIRAGFVGELARIKFLAGEAEDPMTSVPIYVRPSEAELNNPHLA